MFSFESIQRGCFPPEFQSFSCAVNITLTLSPGIRLAYNKTFADCAGAMFMAFMNLALETPHATASTIPFSYCFISLIW